MIDDLLRQSQNQEKEGKAVQLDLFADFNGIPEGMDKTDFHQHDQNWSNRMILGDSLQVMASLAEREGPRGKVQCIYIDPPYRIKVKESVAFFAMEFCIADTFTERLARPTSDEE